MQMPVPMPMPAGTPVPLSAEVAGSLSRLQGQMMAAQPEMQTAYAMHWLAFRQANTDPAFQQMTQNMLWGAYGNLALQGLLRFALSGRATPDVMSGIIDQMRLIQGSYSQAAGALNQFLQIPGSREVAVAAEPMVRSLQPLDQVYQAMQAPMQTVVQNVSWFPSGEMTMVPITRAMVQYPGGPAPEQP